MPSSLVRFAVACLASLAMATYASADTILQFAEAPPATDEVTATSSGGVTTLTTPPGGILVNITSIAGAPFVGTAFETFTTPITSGATASLNGGAINQDSFGGTIVFSSAPGGAGTNILTAMFTGGLLSGTNGGQFVTLGASQPPATVTFSSSIPTVQALISGATGFNFSLSFSGVHPILSISGSQVANFMAVNSGTFSTSTGAVPEPTSVVMASISALAGFGCFGWRRLKASQ